MSSTPQPATLQGGARRRTLRHLLDILLILVAALFIAVKLEEYFGVNLVLLIASLIYILRNIFIDESWRRAGRLNLLDASLAALVLCEIVNYFGSTYRANSFYSVAEMLALFLFYWLIRFNLVREYQRTALYVFLSLCGVILAVAAVYYFRLLNQQVHTLGFDDITNFRNHIYFFNPVGLAVGEWSTVLFVLLPFPLILLVKYRHLRYATWPLTLATVAILVAAALTFIRGVYIGMAAFFFVGSALCWLYGLFPARRLAAFNLTVLALLALSLIPVARPVLTTLSLFGTTSQARSFEGRKTVWKDSLRMVTDHPWLGIGSNNFPMQYVAYRAQRNDTAFAVRPFNSLLQVLIEKGIVGLLVYGFLCLSFFLVSHRKLTRLRGYVYQQGVVVFFMATFVSIIVRDMSESSVLVNRGVGAILWFMFAINAQSPVEVGS